MIIWIIASAVATLVIADVALWWVSRRLSTTEATAVYDVAEATDWVAERLPTAIQRRISHGDVEVMLLSHLAWMRENGLATFGEVDEIAQQAAVGGRDVIGHEDAAVDAVLGDMAGRDADLDALDVVAVLDLSNQYLSSIGALGPSTTL